MKSEGDKGDDGSMERLRNNCDCDELEELDLEVFLFLLLFIMTGCGNDPRVCCFFI